MRPRVSLEQVLLLLLTCVGYLEIEEDHFYSFNGMKETGRLKSFASAWKPLVSI